MQRLSDEGLAQFGLATGDGCVCVYACIYVCGMCERENYWVSVCAGGEIKENKDDWDYNDDKELKSIFSPVRNEKLKMLWLCFLKYRCTGKGQVFSIVL